MLKSSQTTRPVSRLYVRVDLTTPAPPPTVKGVAARGGRIDRGGPAIADGMVYATMGYHDGGGIPGNVQLAFSVDGKRVTDSKINYHTPGTRRFVRAR